MGIPPVMKSTLALDQDVKDAIDLFDRVRASVLKCAGPVLYHTTLHEAFERWLQQSSEAA